MTLLPTLPLVAEGDCSYCADPTECDGGPFCGCRCHDGSLGVVRNTGTQPPPLTPEERRELVERPMPATRILNASRSWGGTSTIDWVGEGRTRAYTTEPTGRMQWLKIQNESGS